MLLGLPVLQLLGLLLPEALPEAEALGLGGTQASRLALPLLPAE